MKKRYILLALILFLTFSVNGQINEGTIIYSKENNRSISKKDLNKKISPKMLEKFKDYEKKIKETTKNINFELIFKNNTALFQVQNLLEIEGKKFFKAAIGPEAAGRFYYNKEIVVWFINAFGEDFIVSKDELVWSLQSNSKKIGKYLCMKANLVVKKNKNSKVRMVTAWYCPEINLPYGPLGYSGLPGLILELEIGNVKYTAKKIEFKKIKNNIIKPEKGKNVSEKEFNDIAKKLMINYKKNKGY